MKIIFLDIDGTLTNTTYAIKNHRKWDVRAEKRKFKQIDTIDPNAITYLNSLIKKTGAKVVISSTWRLGKTVETMQKLLNEVDFKGEIIGLTPHGGKMSLRGNEIYQWIKDNQNLLGCIYFDFEDYVIFDDDSDMLYWQRNNFIHIDSYFGLSPNHCHRAEKILNKHQDNLEQL